MNAGPVLPQLPHRARILLVRLRSIGDIVLLTPALRCLKDWRPDLRISVMVESRFQEVLQDNPCIEETLFPWKGSGAQKLLSRLGSVGEVRRRHFDVCLNLHGGPSSRWFVRWSGAPWRVGFHHFRGASLYNLFIPDARTILNQDSIHTAEQPFAAFVHLGMPRTAIPRAELYCGARQAAWWNAKRAQLGIPAEQPYALIHPTALYKTKEWLPEGFARLGQHLLKSHHIVPIYSCGPEESGVLDAVEKASGAPLRRLEGISLSQFAAALGGARLFVGNDSGPAHMAAALARPLVVIFSSSSSPIWGPWPRPEAGSPVRVVQNPFACNPCPGDHCYQFARPECILSVTFDQVRTAVDEALAQAAAN